MAKQVGLYQYLGREVPAGPIDSTRFTESQETYDDQGLDSLGLPGAMQSNISRNDSETYDDQGFAGLGYLEDTTTIETRSDHETYDEDGALTQLSVADVHATTTLTKVDAETYDDSGSIALSVPLS